MNGCVLPTPMRCDNASIKDLIPQIDNQRTTDFLPMVESSIREEEANGPLSKVCKFAKTTQIDSRAGAICRINRRQPSRPTT